MRGFWGFNGSHERLLLLNCKASPSPSMCLHIGHPGCPPILYHLSRNATWHPTLLNLIFCPFHLSILLPSPNTLPCLHAVVQNIVYTLDDYGVPEDQIFGIRYGLRGFLDRHAKPVQLTKQWVDGIQLKGGTVLVSRGQRGHRASGEAGIERRAVW